MADEANDDMPTLSCPSCGAALNVNLTPAEEETAGEGGESSTPGGEEGGPEAEMGGEEGEAPTPTTAKGMKGMKPAIALVIGKKR